MHHILERFGMLDSKPVPTSIEAKFQTIKWTDTDTHHSPTVNSPYRQAIGSLMFLMIGTRLDIAFAVGFLSKFAESPLEPHWTAVKRVFRYISGTRSPTSVHHLIRTL